MDVQVSQLSPVLMELSITVEPERFKKELDRAFVELGKRARVRGFRPGKAPRDVLAKLYGGQVTSDVASKLVDETLNQALTDKNVQPLSQPKVEVQTAGANKPLTYKARFEVRPEIADLKWEGLEAEKPKVSVDDAQVDAAIEALRKSHAQVSVPEPARAAKQGDVVTIDFTAEIDGKQIDSGKGVTADLGEGKLVKELEEAIVGGNVGDHRHVDVTFPKDHSNPALQGKTAHFHLDIKEIKERKLPDLDDEFAKDVGDFADLSALRKDAREKLLKQAEDAAEQQMVTALVAALCNANAVEAPPTLVQQQMQLTLQELQLNARRSGQRVQMTPELERQLRVDSDVKVRAGLLMAEIAKKNNVVIGDEDIEKGLEELAKETGKNVARLRAEYRDQNRRQMLIGMILEDKVLDLMIAKAKIKEVDAKG